MEKLPHSAVSTSVYCTYDVSVIECGLKLLFARLNHKPSELCAPGGLTTFTRETGGRAQTPWRSSETTLDAGFGLSRPAGTSKEKGLFAPLL